MLSAASHLHFDASRIPAEGSFYLIATTFFADVADIQRELVDLPINGGVASDFVYMGR